MEGAIHRGRPLRRGPLIDRVMVALATILLVAVGIKLVTGGALGRGIADVQLDWQPRPPAGSAVGDDAVADAQEHEPDIVMIMLDGYPGDAAARLATENGSPYDPDAFPDALTSLGFNVQRNSHSNYLLTPMTLASVLDMRHLVEEPGLIDAGIEAAGGRGFRRVADSGEALDVLHDRGYELVWVDGGFSHIEIRRVDRWIENGAPSEIEERVLSDTVLGHAINTVAPDLLSSLHRSRVLTTIADAPRLIAEPHDQPRFLFVHVPAPHAPWVFGPNGEPRTEGLDSFYMDPVGVRDIDRPEAIRRVFDQASYVADQTLDAVEDLLERPDPPVVIIFSDHGPGTEIDFNEPAKTDLVERSQQLLRRLHAWPTRSVRRVHDAGQHLPDAVRRLLRARRPAPARHDLRVVGPRGQPVPGDRAWHELAMIAGPGDGLREAPPGVPSPAPGPREPRHAHPRFARGPGARGRTTYASPIAVHRSGIRQPDHPGRHRDDRRGAVLLPPADRKVRPDGPPHGHAACAPGVRRLARQPLLTSSAGDADD